MVENDTTLNLSELAESVERLVPYILDYHDLVAPEIKRRQRNVFWAIFSIVVATFLLSCLGVMDGSAAMVVFGAVLYYIFRNNAPDNMLASVIRQK